MGWMYSYMKVGILKAKNQSPGPKDGMIVANVTILTCWERISVQISEVEDQSLSSAPLGNYKIFGIEPSADELWGK